MDLLSPSAASVRFRAAPSLQFEAGKASMAAASGAPSPNAFMLERTAYDAGGDPLEVSLKTWRVSGAPGFR